jgi:hypothetical protein
MYRAGSDSLTTVNLGTILARSALGAAKDRVQEAIEGDDFCWGFGKTPDEIIVMTLHPIALVKFDLRKRTAVVLEDQDWFEGVLGRRLTWQEGSDAPLRVSTGADGKYALPLPGRRSGDIGQHLTELYVFEPSTNHLVAAGRGTPISWVGKDKLVVLNQRSELVVDDLKHNTSRKIKSGVAMAAWDGKHLAFVPMKSIHKLRANDTNEGAIWSWRVTLSQLPTLDRDFRSSGAIKLPEKLSFSLGGWGIAGR